MATLPLVLEADPVQMPYSVTTVVGTNGDLIAEVAKVPRYNVDGKTVADVTFGKGNFWSKMDTTRFTLLGSDLHLAPTLLTAACAAQASFWPDQGPVLREADFCALPYASGSIQVMIVDPPYRHTPGEKQAMNALYRNHQTAQGMYHRDILRDFYCPAIQEAARVLTPGGFLWAKGMDEIESGRQCWSHAEVRRAAERCGFTAEDLYILVTYGAVPPTHRQIHARKNSSWLWIFQRQAQPKTAKRGRPKKGSVRTPSPQRRGREYFVTRLLRDFPAVYARYQAGELPSINAAAREAGMVKARH
jgi:hypothetical protein